MNLTRENTLKFLLVALLLYLMLSYTSRIDSEWVFMPADSKEISLSMFSAYGAPMQVLALVLVVAMLGGVFLAREDKA